jgi:hypothetical protein
MCEDCGCGDSELVPLEVQARILAGNDRTASHNRAHFEAAGVLAARPRSWRRPHAPPAVRCGWRR